MLLSLNELFYNGYMITLNTNIYVYSNHHKLIFSGEFKNCPEIFCNLDIVGFSSCESGYKFTLNV